MEKEIIRLTEALDNARKAAETNARELAEVRFDPRLIDRRTEIEGLNQTIQAVKDARQNLPIDQRKHDESIRKIRSRLASLVPDWSLDDLRDFRLTATLEAQVDALTTEHDDRVAALNELAKTRDGHLESLQNAQSELVALGESIDVAPLTSALEEEAEYKNNLKARKDLEGAYRKTRRDIDDLLPRLNPPLDRPSCEAVELPTPPREVVARFKRDFQRIDQQIDASNSSVERDEAALDVMERELAALSARCDDLPTPAGLAELRRRRDLGWDLVRRKHVDHEAVEAEVHAWLVDNAPDSVHDLLDAYRHTVLATDQYADDLFKQSSAVAKKEQIETPASALSGIVGRSTVSFRCVKRVTKTGGRSGSIAGSRRSSPRRWRAGSTASTNSASYTLGSSSTSKRDGPFAIRSRGSRIDSASCSMRPSMTAPRSSPRPAIARDVSEPTSKRAATFSATFASFRTRPTGPRRGGSSFRAGKRSGPTAGEPCCKSFICPLIGTLD